MEDIIKEIKEEWNNTHFQNRKDIIMELKKFVLEMENQIEKEDQTFYR